MHNLSFEFYSLTDLTPIFTIGLTYNTFTHTKHFYWCIWLKICFSHVLYGQNILQLLWLFCGRSDKFIRKFFFLHMAWFMHLIHSYCTCLYTVVIKFTNITRRRCRETSETDYKWIEIASVKLASERNKQAKTHCSNNHKMSVCNTHSKLSILTACNERTFICICK